MTDRKPRVELDATFSDENAQAVDWPVASDGWARAGVCWLSTVRPDGRPHVTPIAFVWVDDTVFFSTGPGERKSRNLEQNAHVVATTGCNEFSAGLDLVIEGGVVPVGDRATLQRLAEAFRTKYDDFFGFTAGDGHLSHGGGIANVFRIEPSKGFAYGRGDSFSATRYRFS